MHHTLALRLTVWYASIFALSSLLAFTLVYVLMVTVVQQRTDQDLQEDIAEYAGFMRLGGFDKVKAETAFETQGEEASTVFFRLWTRDGRLIATTDLSPWPELDKLDMELPQLKEGDTPVLKTFELPEREYTVRSIYGAIGPNVVLEIGESLENDEEFLAALLNGFFVALLAVIALGGPIGWFMARRALRGVEEVTRTAMEIADGAFDQRVAVRTRGDELDRLAQAFNTMLDRIQALILGMREMTDNLAHDLRSPVARIRASAEMALTSSGSGTDWEALASDTTEECDRLLEMINTTLDIAEAESGAAKLRISEVDLVAIVADACDLFQTVAEDKDIELAVDLPPQCFIQGDLQRLQRVVANLLDNALKYTLQGGRVTFHLIDEERRVHLAVIDTGVGITAEELPKIFQRFYRCDWSRSEYGNGLGLSLALAFVRAHGGDITVRSVLGEGSTFTVILPRSHRGH
ncbi:MAG: HAMP domain-containing histidine kinase [Gammaproteobacteria bacterium]|nr:HAMP domain-containing histidine kinase [Gammaproteobacteria bacterium]